MGVVVFLRLVNDYKAYGHSVFKSCRSVERVLSRPGWTLPAVGKICLNRDAAVMDNVGVGLRIVLRESTTVRGGWL